MVVIKESYYYYYYYYHHRRHRHHHHYFITAVKLIVHSATEEGRPGCVLWCVSVQSDGREFPSTTRTLQKSGNLTIARLTADDHGRYECVARNVIADVITATFIIIESTPQSINQSIDQSINQREICRAPLYDTSRNANSSQW